MNVLKISDEFDANLLNFVDFPIALVWLRPIEMEIEYESMMEEMQRHCETLTDIESQRSLVRFEPGIPFVIKRDDMKWYRAEVLDPGCGDKVAFRDESTKLLCIIMQLRGFFCRFR